MLVSFEAIWLIQRSWNPKNHREGWHRWFWHAPNPRNIHKCTSLYGKKNNPFWFHFSQWQTGGFQSQKSTTACPKLGVNSFSRPMSCRLQHAPVWEVLQVPSHPQRFAAIGFCFKMDSARGNAWKQRNDHKQKRYIGSLDLSCWHSRKYTVISCKGSNFLFPNDGLLGWVWKESMI